MRAGGTRLLRRMVLSRGFLVAVSCLVSLAAAEGLARIVERAELASTHLDAAKVADARLGARVQGHGSGSDAWGFRNASVPEHADVVVLGDSQAWGVNARIEEAWPQRLAVELGQSTYNMSLGGYGAVHYGMLLDEALALSPRTVIFAIYAGNDIYDSYSLVYRAEAHADLRLPDAALGDDTLQARADALWNEHLDFQQAFGTRDPRNWGLWLRGHTALGRRIEKTGWLPEDSWFRIGAAWAAAHPDHGAFCDCGAVRTVFTTAYRLLALDLSEPRIAEGLRLTRLAITRSAQTAASSGAGLVVVLVPTKERVYADLMRQRGGLDPTFARLVDAEDRVRDELLGLCRSSAIPFLDLRPAMSRAVSEGTALYPFTTESHPSPPGYAVMARETAAFLRSLPDAG